MATRGDELFDASQSHKYFLKHFEESSVVTSLTPEEREKRAPILSKYVEHLAEFCQEAWFSTMTISTRMSEIFHMICIMVERDFERCYLEDSTAATAGTVRRRIGEIAPPEKVQKYEDSLHNDSVRERVKIEQVPERLTKLPIWNDMYEHTISVFRHIAEGFWRSMCKLQGWKFFVHWTTPTAGLILCTEKKDKKVEVKWRIPVFAVFGPDSEAKTSDLALHVFTNWTHGWMLDTAVQREANRTLILRMPRAINGVPLIYHDNQVVRFTVRPSVDRVHYYVRNQMPTFLCSSPNVQFQILTFADPQQDKEEKECTYLNNVTQDYDQEIDAEDDERHLIFNHDIPIDSDDSDDEEDGSDDEDEDPTVVYKI